MPAKFHANPLPYWADPLYVVISTNKPVYHILTPDFAKAGALCYGTILCRNNYITTFIEIEARFKYYVDPPKDLQLCDACKERLQDMIRLAFEPGSQEAVEYGCTCKVKNIPWQLDRHVTRCPLYKKPKISPFRAATTHWA